MEPGDCDHDWIVDFDPVADAACYNDGLNYRPAEYICTKCKMKKKIHYEDDTTLEEVIKVLLVGVVTILYLIFIAPIIMIVSWIKDRYFST